MNARQHEATHAKKIFNAYLFPTVSLLMYLNLPSLMLYFNLE